MMARHVTISTLGPAPFAMDERKNLDLCVQKMIDHWDRELSNVLPSKPDLIVLPEACDRFADFTGQQNSEYYQVRGNRIRDHFAETARAYNCNIAYPAYRRMPDGTYRNSTQFISRSGGIAGIYNKNHLVVTEHTETKVLYGREVPVIQMDFGTVGGVICFDLNFDELRRKYMKIKPDLLVFCSMYHGGLMQNYWAYSCRAHLVSAVAGLPCSIISPVGSVIASSTNYFCYTTATVNLDCAVVHLDFNWDRLKKLKEKYGRKVTIYDPGYLGCVLISSESDETSISDMIKEFDIELLDDYFERSSAMRREPGAIEP